MHFDQDSSEHLCENGLGRLSLRRRLKDAATSLLVLLSLIRRPDTPSRWVWR